MLHIISVISVTIGLISMNMAAISNVPEIQTKVLIILLTAFSTFIALGYID